MLVEVLGLGLLGLGVPDLGVLGVEPLDEESDELDEELSLDPDALDDAPLESLGRLSLR